MAGSGLLQFIFKQKREPLNGEGRTVMGDLAEIMKKSMAAGIGIIAFTANKAQEFVDDMVERGELTREQGTSIIKEIAQQGEETRKQLSEMMRAEVRKVVDEANIASKDDLKRLEDKIDYLILTMQPDELVE
jgi:polyhydroxyalkanoate synthesis regulator phasin